MAAGPHTLNFSSNISYEITEEGYLLQREGVNPETGKAWEPTWVSKSICPPEIVELWEVRKMVELDEAPSAKTSRDAEAGSSMTSKARKRPLSETQSLDVHKVIRDQSNGDAPQKDANIEKLWRLFGEHLTPVEEHSPSKRVRFAEDKEAVCVESGHRSRPSLLAHNFSPIASKLSPTPPPKKCKPSFIPKKRISRVEPLKPSTVDSAHADKPTVPESQCRKEFSELDAKWLLNPVLQGKKGIVVMVKNSFDPMDGWHGGEYEGAEGMVLSVLNTGNSSFVSTALVKLLAPADPSLPSYSIPVEFLWPVEPSKIGQRAVILEGQEAGEVAILREECADGWFVSTRSTHFEVTTTNLVLLKEGGSIEE